MAQRFARDVREAPVYTAPEAARYLHLPPATVRALAFGQRYDKSNPTGAFQPVIMAASRATRRLSFINLIELLALAAIRRMRAVALPEFRRVMSFLEREFPGAHPLADHQFQTSGADFFVDKIGEMLKLSRDRRVQMGEVVHAYLRCVEWNERGVPVKLYLPSLKPPSVESGVIVIDPRISFGRPVLDGAGVRAEIIVDRFRAGEPIDCLAQDYGRSREEIEAVIRSGLAATA